MPRALAVSCLFVLLACERPAPPSVYELQLPLAVPDGTEVVIDGEVAGTFTSQKARVKLSKGASLADATSIAIRLQTVCGHADRPVTVSSDRLAGRKDADDGSGQPRTIPIALEMDRVHVPVLTTIWVDPEASGEVKIGSKTLNKGPNRVLLADCDETGRLVTVGGERRASAPAYDPKGLDQLFVPASTDRCYALHTQVYAEGNLDPERRTSERLTGKPLYEVPLLSFFLREAPEQIEAIPGAPTEEKKELARIDCEARLESPTGSASPSGS